jgi:uncharacterized protein
VTEAVRPYPQPDDVTRPFWEAIAEGVLRLQHCRACDRHVFFPRAVCPHCTSAALEWVDATGRGTVYSLTVVHRAAPGFDDAPYTVALIDLEEGVRMMTQLVDAPAGGFSIGQAVELTIRGQPPLPYFSSAG